MRWQKTKTHQQPKEQNMNICQSCGMPLDEKTTSKCDGNYCVYCQNQETCELASKDQVREGSIKAAMEHMGKTREEAESMTDETMSKLPRWRQSE